MSPQTLGLIALTIATLISVPIIGFICQRKGQIYGEKLGEERGRLFGWVDAHDRVAEALRIDADALRRALLELESADHSSDPSVTFGKFVRSISVRKTAANKNGPGVLEHHRGQEIPTDKS